MLNVLAKYKLSTMGQLYVLIILAIVCEVMGL